LEIVGKKSLEELIQHYICKPLKMHSTIMKPSLSSAPDLKLVEGYMEKSGLKNDVEVPPWDQLVTAGAGNANAIVVFDSYIGALLSTIQDMFLFLESCVSPPESLQPIIEECQKVLYQSDKYRIGCGWFFKKATDDSPTCWHNGGTGSLVIT
jgi:CubicO group peptidase (beta-lactamase class C family)